ncbi:MAG: deoxyribonuclease IV [Candidatus Sabulitectum sp.]|nr:deoxyribonuclease IV [Candidatus Sabulitectum sp.]
MIPGIHVSTAGGIYKAPLKLRELDLTTGQMFTANQRRWKNSELPLESIDKFCEASEGLTIIAHASYLINLASANPEVIEKSHIALVEELKRCKALGIHYLVLHPGAHQKAGLDKGIYMISSALTELLPLVDSGSMLLLENTAGAGTTIGCRLEELSAIRDSAGVPELIGYCIDTAHAHGAGYRITDPETVTSFVEQLDMVLGCSNIKAFHLNDSKVECDSRRDRHEHFGAGTIGVEGLRFLFQSPLLSRIPGIAETPGTDDERATDIRKLT